LSLQDWRDYALSARESGSEQGYEAIVERLQERLGKHENAQAWLGASLGTAE
jgi:hypothetical protein